MQSCRSLYTERNIDFPSDEFHFPIDRGAEIHIHQVDNVISREDGDILRKIYFYNIELMREQESNVLEEPLVWTTRISATSEKRFIKELQDRLFQVVANIFPLENARFDLSVISRMRAGQKMIEHADNADYHCPEHGDHQWSDAPCDAGRWVPLKNRWYRDYSVILYFGDDPVGGELYFPQYGKYIPAARGTLVAFPSNRYYLHRVETVVSGERFAFASWLTNEK